MTEEEFCRKWRLDTWTKDYPDTMSCVFLVRVLNLTQERLEMAREMLQSGVGINPLCRKVAAIICAGEI